MSKWIEQITQIDIRVDKDAHSHALAGSTRAVGPLLSIFSQGALDERFRFFF